MFIPPTDLQRDHVGSVLPPYAEVIHEKLQHVKGLLFTHVEEQNSSHKADTLAVANLCSTRILKKMFKKGVIANFTTIITVQALK